MNHSRFVFSGFRMLTGVFLIVFGLVSAALYYLDSAIKPAGQTVITLAAPTAEANKSVSQDTPLPILSTSLKPKAKINLLTATQADLETLPGIGPSKAKAILEYRDTKGFKKVDELLNVKGIGEKTLEALRPMVEL